MPKSCLVAFCKNRGKLPGIRYFSITGDRRQSWLQAIGRHPDDKISGHAVICSDHFKQEDVLENGKLKDVVPSLKLRPEKPSFRNHLNRRFSKEVENLNLQAPSVLQVLQLQEGGKPSASCQPAAISEDVSDRVSLASTSNDEREMSPTENARKRKRRESRTSCSDSMDFKRSSKKRRRINHSRTDHSYYCSPRKMKTVRRRIDHSRIDHSYYCSPRKTKTVIANTTSESQLATELKISKQKIIQLKRKVKNLSNLVSRLNNKKFIYEKAKAVLEKSFSGVPAALLKRMFENAHKKKTMKKKFDMELKSFAIMLSFYSAEAYEYVRNVFDLALPSLSTIRSWMTNVDRLPDFLLTSLDLLNIEVSETVEK